MNALERVQSTADRLKVFPLPSAVLFPHSLLPLHIFEPRYRAMVQDALAGDRVIALGGLKAGWESDYEGRPPLLPLVCAGVVAWHEELPDGRYNLLLQGMVRARMMEELPPAHPYREVKSELLPDATYHGPEEELLRQALLEMTGRLPVPLADSLLQVAARAQGGALADVVASAVVQDPEQRLAVLAALDVRERLNLVLEEVEDLLVRMPPTERLGPPN
ncbi:MAG: LON peptidase substrate-binding domain-containing protein [Myxococcaceae bacterium]|nr:LON peptidase substrate-binding domain-containing protein [Myxococcaceae bacterium]MCI0669204.1 LON peptidase substrate-binding domain-containing protein [Myxococcaceae bacterium]